MRLQSSRWLLTTTMAISRKDVVEEAQAAAAAAAPAAQAVTPTVAAPATDAPSFSPSKDGVASPKMKRILCLHGKSQSGAILSNKIAGARKKLQRVYELDFLDGPVLLTPPPPTSSTIDGGSERDSSSSSSGEASAYDAVPPAQYAWWLRDDATGKHVGVRDAFEYVIDRAQGKSYDAILGFSQGGLLGTALALSGALPTVRAVVTAGSPYVEEPFLVARDVAAALTGPGCPSTESGRRIPKLHFAGATDAMISVASTGTLCEEGGNGRMVVHEKGHLFPTKAAYVNEILDFLVSTLRDTEVDDDDEDDKDLWNFDALPQKAG
jgi:Serine hydrolase (FSH1)